MNTKKAMMAQSLISCILTHVTVDEQIDQEYAFLISTIINLNNLNLFENF